jgi:hypothetical protein
MPVDGGNKYPRDFRDTWELRSIGWVEGTAILLFCLIVINSGLYQLYPRIGWVDPGLYIYNFLDLPQNVAVHGADYHSTRLPFVLVGRFLYSVFPAFTAQRLLVNLFYAISCLALVLIGRILISNLPLRLTYVLAIALNPAWIACFVEGYVDGPAIAFALLSTAAALAGTPRLLGLPRELWAGAAMALAASTHPIPGIYAGLVLLLVPLFSERNWSRIALAWLWASLGCLATIIFIGILGSTQGAPFLYLLASVGPAQRSLAGFGFTYMDSVSAWLPGATRTVILPLTLIMVGMLVIRRKDPPPNSRERGLLAASGVGIVMFSAFEVKWPGFFLQFRFYASYLFLFLIPALALLLSSGFNGQGRRSNLSLLYLAAGLALLAAGLVGARVLAGQQAVPFAWTSLILLMIIALIGLASGFTRSGIAATLGTLALAAAADHETGMISRLNSTIDHSAQFRVVAEFQRILKQDVPHGQQVLTWFNREKFNADTAGTLPQHIIKFDNVVYRLNLLDSVAATAGWHLTSLGFSMPLPEGATYAQLTNHPRSTLVLLCVQENDCQRGLSALTSLAELKIKVTRRLQQEINVPTMPKLIVQVADISSEAGAPGTAPREP